MISEKGIQQRVKWELVRKANECKHWQIRDVVQLHKVGNDVYNENLASWAYINSLEIAVDYPCSSWLLTCRKTAKSHCKPTLQNSNALESPTLCFYHNKVTHRLAWFHMRMHWFECASKPGCSRSSLCGSASTIPNQSCRCQFNLQWNYESRLMEKSYSRRHKKSTLDKNSCGLCRIVDRVTVSAHDVRSTRADDYSAFCEHRRQETRHRRVLARYMSSSTTRKQ